MKDKVKQVAIVVGSVVLHAGVFVGCYKLGAKLAEKQNKRNMDYLAQQLSNAIKN